MDLTPRNIRSEKSINQHHLNSPTLTLLVSIAALGALLYTAFIFNPRNAGDLIGYIMVLAAESFIIFQALLSLWTILSGGFNPRDFEYFVAKRNLLQGPARNTGGKLTPTMLPLYLHREAVEVDVFIPVYGESTAKVKATMLAALNLVGVHETYILDDGKNDELRTLSIKHGARYIRRPDNAGSKAGNINYALRQTAADFFVIFDADFVAKPNFLIETLPFFAKSGVAFVQTPQHYGNLHNTISRGAGYIQNVFYRLIQPGKNRFDAAFCVGTNVIFRRSAIDEIGGMYQASKSEDIWTSLLLHERGFHSVFISDILATGDAPETIEAFMKQQLRWATGGFEILIHHNPLRSNLTMDQKVQYLGTTTYYLHGLAIFLLMLLPPLHIVFNLSPVNLSVGFASWLFFYLAFYATQVVVAFYTMEGFRLETIIIAMASFPVYIQALTNVIRGRSVAWQATGNRAVRQSPFNFIVPQILIFGFLSIISVIGVWKAMYTGTFALSLVWNVLNTLIFGAFLLMAFREKHQPKPQLVTVSKSAYQEQSLATRKVHA